MFTNQIDRHGARFTSVPTIDANSEKAALQLDGARVVSPHGAPEMEVLLWVNFYGKFTVVPRSNYVKAEVKS